MMSVLMGMNHFRFLSFNPQAGAKPAVLQGKRPYANNDMHSSPDDCAVGDSWTRESQVFGDVVIGELSLMANVALRPFLEGFASGLGRGAKNLQHVTRRELNPVQIQSTNFVHVRLSNTRNLSCLTGPYINQHTLLQAQGSSILHSICRPAARLNLRSGYAILQMTP
jgi:hypothetical protein